MFKIAVLVSGGGSNLQALIDAVSNNELDVSIEYVIADRPAFGLKRAEEAGIKTCLLERNNELSSNIHSILKGKVDLIVLAGFLSILTNEFCRQWKDKVINIHPSLLPKFGGSGMYGIKVHEAVIKNNEKETGATVHFVQEEIDGGEIILQRSVNVPEGISPKDLQQKVLNEVEHKILKEAIKLIVDK